MEFLLEKICYKITRLKKSRKVNYGHNKLTIT